MPAPKNNENARRHGQRCRFGLMIGGGPKATRYITAKLCVFREALEQAVIVAHGEVGLLHAAAISTALRWERASALSTKWFRENGDAMTVLDRVALQKSIAEASERRDRALEKLKIDAKPSDLWAAVYSQPLPSTPPQPPADSKPAEPPPDAADASVGGASGNDEGGQG
jgi:hypothetical protein